MKIKTKRAVLLFVLSCAAVGFGGCADYYAGNPGYGPTTADHITLVVLMPVVLMLAVRITGVVIRARWQSKLAIGLTMFTAPVIT